MSKAMASDSKGDELWDSKKVPGKGAQGFSEYSVGMQGQAAEGGDEGAKALEVQGANGVWGSHEHFSDVQKGGQTGEEK